MKLKIDLNSNKINNLNKVRKGIVHVIFLKSLENFLPIVNEGRFRDRLGAHIACNSIIDRLTGAFIMHS